MRGVRTDDPEDIRSLNEGDRVRCTDLFEAPHGRPRAWTPSGAMLGRAILTSG